MKGNSRVRLTWENLCVDAELPPPSCFARLKSRGEDHVIKNTSKPILKGGIVMPTVLVHVFQLAYFKNLQKFMRNIR